MSNIRQRLASQGDKSILLHTSWRQPVLARNQGRKIRLFGGENFTRDYDYLGFQHAGNYGATTRILSAPILGLQTLHCNAFSNC